MKKNKKRILFVLIIMFISTFTMTAFQMYAVNATNIGDIDYTYEGMTEEKAESLIKSMFGISDNPLITPYSLFCLFGHSIETGSITTTEHRYYSSFPRCRVTYSSVEYCSRSSCDYFIIKSQYYNVAGCCN